MTHVPAGGIEHLYRPGEAFFAGYGPRMRSLGWCPIPQTRDGVRKPGRVGGTPLRYAGFREAMPAPDAVAIWALECPTHNVALLLRDDQFVLDIDVNDETLAWQLRDMADEVLGVTPYKRVGRAPRVVLVYRAAPDLKGMRNKPFRFATAGNSSVDSGDAFEVLTAGSLVTAYGNHHKTGFYFSWVGAKQPYLDGPEFAPLVTKDQMAEFVRRAAEFRPLYKRAPHLPSSPGAILNPHAACIYSCGPSQIYTPILATAVGDYVVDAEGMCVDGREAYVTAFMFAFMRANEATVRAHRDHDLAKHAFECLETTVRMSGERDARWLTQVIREKTSRLAERFRAGDYKFGRPVATRMGQHEIAKAHDLPQARPANGSMSWLGTGDPAAALDGWATKVKSTSPVFVPGAAEKRALIDDRSALIDDMRAKMKASFQAFFDDVRAGRHHVHVNSAPTGAGKTVVAAEAIVAYARTLDEDAGPIIVAAPNHQNLGELRAALERCGATFDHGQDGIKSCLFEGKRRAGCRQEDRLDALEDAGIGSSGLCKSSRKDDLTGEKVEVWCPFWGLCAQDGYQAMRARARVSRIVILPHAWLSIGTLPQELRHPTAVVIDESISSQVIKSGFLPWSSMGLERAETHLLKREREEGVQEGELAAERKKAVEIAIEAGERMADPASVFAATPRGLRMVRDAKRVCSSAMSRVRELQADVTEAKFADLTHYPAGEDLAIEWRFWQMIEERIEGVEKGILCGDRDVGLQSVVKGVDAAGQPIRGFRVSWRSTDPWPKTPHMLLDASADLEVSALLFDALNPAVAEEAALIEANPKARRLVHHAFDVPLDLRVVAVADATYAKSQFIPRLSSDPKVALDQRLKSAAVTDRTQKLISIVAGQYAYGRMVLAASLDVRAHLLGSSVAPSNLDSGHFGALRGIDAYRDHVAALIVGRTEQPVSVVDALVGALTRKSRCPELPHDMLGTGIDAQGKPVLRVQESRVVRLRSGHDVQVPSMEMPGYWARKVDRLWREEETRQALGRLRPIHANAARWETPVAVLQSSIVPDGLIVDEMISMDDVLAGPDASLMVALRESHGVLCSAITPVFAKVAAEQVTRFVSAPTTRSHWGLTPAAWTGADGVEHRCMVASHFDDPESEIIQAVERAGLGAVARVEIWTPTRARVAAQAAAPDKVSKTFLSLDDVASMEVAWAERVEQLGAAEQDNLPAWRRDFETEWRCRSA